MSSGLTPLASMRARYIGTLSYSWRTVLTSRSLCSCIRSSRLMHSIFGFQILCSRLVSLMGIVPPLVRQPSTCEATRCSAEYILRSFGFSIFPVGLRGTSAKMMRRGRL